MNCSNDNNTLTDGITFIVLSSAIAIIIAEDFDQFEQNLIGNFLIAIGQNLTTLASTSFTQFFNNNNSTNSLTSSNTNNTINTNSISNNNICICN